MDLPSQVHVEEDEEGEAAAAQEELAERKRSPSPATISTTAPSTGTNSHLSNKVVRENSVEKASKVQPRLMEKISAKKEVDETTVFPGNEVPLFGVHSEEQNELERVSLLLALGIFSPGDFFAKGLFAQGIFRHRNFCPWIFLT